MPSQRPFFLSTFFAAFRQQSPAPLSSQQGTKHTGQSGSTQSYTTASSTQRPAPSAPRAISSSSSPSSAAQPASRATGIASQLPRPSPHHAAEPSGRRRGSDSSSEGFRDVLGADKWYIGGRTAAGEEKFFKLGVVRRVRSRDRLSLDRLSL